MLGGLSPTMPGYLEVVTNDKSTMVFKSYEVDYITIDKLPEHAKTYIVGLEDQNFYKHNGYDFKRIVKSFIQNSNANEIVSGGSTITQQLARILYLNNEKSYKRKILELVYARRLENGLSKNKILELYLNEVFFGDNLYGINSAAKSYFNKSADELTKPETLLLYSILPAPNLYSPRVNLELSKEIYFKAAKNLIYRKIIDELEFNELITNYPDFIFENTIRNDTSWYNQSIYEQLRLSNVDIDKNNITISSLQDQFVQSILEEVVKEFNYEEKTDIGIVVLEPSTGNVLGIIGGKEKDDFNRVILTKKAIGSTVKPILYTLALENGFTPSSSFTSEPVSFYLDDDIVYSPSNNNNLYANRKINMVEALALSDNIYATKTLLLLGTKSLTNKLSHIGIKIDSNITNALGSFSLTLLQLASIYNALANNGIYNSPKFFSSYKINDKIYNNAQKKFQLFDERESRIMSYMLLSTQDKALKTYSTPTMLYNKPEKRFGIKTGTTESSSFAVGYNPFYTIAIYVGTDDNSKLFQSSISRVMFKKIADKLMEHKKDIYFSTHDLKPFILLNQQTNTQSFTYYK